MTRSTVKANIESFPNSIILKIERELDYKSIKSIEKLVIANALLCKSELEGGLYSLLGLVITAARYSTIIGYKFVSYNNPGALPTFLPNPVQLQITQANATYKE